MQGYFYWWVILSFIWGIVAAALAFSMPIIESHYIIYGFLGSVLRNRTLQHWAAKEMPEEYASEDETPDAKVAVPQDSAEEVSAHGPAKSVV